MQRPSRTVDPRARARSLSSATSRDFPIPARQLVCTAEEPRRRLSLRCGCASSPGGRLADRGLEAGVLVQHPELKGLQRRGRLDTELVVERAPEALVGPERLGLAPGAVEGKDQLPVEALGSGCCAASDLTSPTTSRWRPPARSASIRSSRQPRRNSSKWAPSTRA